MNARKDERRRPLATAALFAASVLLTLAAAEIAARLLADPTGGNAEILAQAAQARAMSVHVASADPELTYVNRPSYVTSGVRITESHGIVRATDVTLEKPPGTFRIAVLGDSIAAAHPIRVGRQECFAERLERRLNAAGRAGRFEVLNFGTDGYGTAQEARLLMARAAGFAPDLLLVQYCLNDPARSYTPTVWFEDGKAPRSYLLNLVRRRLGLVPSELCPAHPRYTHGAIDWERLYKENAAGWQGVLRAFAQIGAYGRAHSVPVVLALFPLIREGNEPPAETRLISRLCAQVGDAARRHAFHVVDLGPAFSAHTAAELRLLPGDPIHPNALGHAVAADAILASLEAAGLLP